MRITAKTVIYLLLSGAYLCVLQLTPFTGDFAVKAAPVLLLAFSVLQHLSGAERMLLFAALLFSAGGDVALTFVRGSDQNFFILGLGLFLLAHVFYCILFARKLEFIPKRMPFMALILAFSTTMCILLAPKLGDMKLPVFAYITVITCMGILSLARSPLSTIIPLGAAIFMISDSCIAVNKFMQPFTGAGYAIMATYYLAQYLIAKGFLKDKF